MSEPYNYPQPQICRILNMIFLKLPISRNAAHENRKTDTSLIIKYAMNEPYNYQQLQKCRILNMTF